MTDSVLFPVLCVHCRGEAPAALWSNFVYWFPVCADEGEIHGRSVTLSWHAASLRTRRGTYVMVVRMTLLAFELSRSLVVYHWDEMCGLGTACRCARVGVDLFDALAEMVPMDLREFFDMRTSSTPEAGRTRAPLSPNVEVVGESTEGEDGDTEVVPPTPVTSPMLGATYARSPSY